MAALLSGAGLGTLVRAWGQNRNERHGTLTTEQQQFREAQRDAIAELRQRNEYLIGRLDGIDTRNAELVQANAVLTAQAEVRELQIERYADQLIVAVASRDRLSNKVAELEAKIRDQAEEITALKGEIAELKRDPHNRTRVTD